MSDSEQRVYKLFRPLYNKTADFDKILEDIAARRAAANPMILEELGLKEANNIVIEPVPDEPLSPNIVTIFLI